MIAVLDHGKELTYDFWQVFYLTSVLDDSPFSSQFISRFARSATCAP